MVRKSKNLEKSLKKLKKIIFFAKKSENFENDFFAEKKMLLSYFCQFRRLVFNQRSPVHPVSESRGGSTSVTKSKEKTEILVSNFGLFISISF